MLVGSRMTSAVLTVTSDTTVADALGVTQAHGIRHLPVIDGERLVGMVTDCDLQLALSAAPAHEHAPRMPSVRDVMTTAVITVAPDTPVEEAVRLLYTHRIGCLPVLHEERLVGILTGTDLLRAFAELFGSGAATTRIEVQMPNRPGELARVVRLVGIEHRINIASMVVPPSKDGRHCVAIMHLQSAQPTRVIRALRKAGYRVGLTSLEADPEVDTIPDDDHSPHSELVRGRALAEL